VSSGSQLSSWFFALSAKTSTHHLPLSFICFGDGGVEPPPGKRADVGARPVPSMNGMIGRSGTTSRPPRIVIAPPLVAAPGVRTGRCRAWGIAVPGYH